MATVPGTGVCPAGLRGGGGARKMAAMCWRVACPAGTHAYRLPLEHHHHVIGRGGITRPRGEGTRGLLSTNRRGMGIQGGPHHWVHTFTCLGGLQPLLQLLHQLHGSGAQPRATTSSRRHRHWLLLLLRWRRDGGLLPLLLWGCRGCGLRQRLLRHMGCRWEHGLYRWGRGRRPSCPRRNL